MADIKELESAIETCNSYLDNETGDYILENFAISLALNALQEKLQRDNGCEYCNVPDCSTCENSTDDELMRELNCDSCQGNGVLTNYKKDVNINFCSKCGKDIRE